MADTTLLRSTLLRSTLMFAGLDDESLRRITTTASTHLMQRGDVLFTEGAHPDALYIVVSGRVAIVNQSTEGRESVVALMEAGDLFGEMGFFDDHGRSASARVLEPAEVLAIPYEPLRQLYEDRPQALWSVVRLLASRLRSTDRALADTVFLDVTGRTAKRLLEMAGDSDEFTLPVTQEELAGMVGASRERVNKAIASFVRLGWIQQSERRYAITNRKQLSIRAG